MLRAEVESLLGALSAAGEFLASPTARSDEAPTADGPGDGSSIVSQESPGDVIGRYKLLQVIGEGGFGTVWMAEQTEPVLRRVALKIIKLGMDTKQVIARFEAERQALALMDHPSIARVFDAGATETGRPYFVMELVRGEPITEYCDRHRLPPPERLSLFAQVCRAVQHAHQKGIIHRDVKPSNVLVTVADGRPLPKVIDFGIAKATSARLTERTLFTEHRQLVGTPEYMSPEQAEMLGVDVDTRTDVYSLGVLLYELLTGATPFDGKRLRSAAFGELLRIIREEDPPTPSGRLSGLTERLGAIASRRGTTPDRLGRLVRGELDWIVMRALEKDRTRRYETASALAADVERFLRDEPVEAGPPGSLYRLVKFVKRRKGPVMAGVAIAVLLLGGVIASTAFALRAERQRAVAVYHSGRAGVEAAKAERVARFTREMFTSIDPAVAGDLDKQLMRLVLDGAAAKVDDEVGGDPEVEASIRLAIGQAYTAIGEYALAEPHCLRALDLNRTALDAESPEALAAQRGLMDVYARQGRYDESESLARGVYEVRRRRLGEDHPETLESLADAAFALYGRGQFADALATETRVLEARRRVLGPRHKDTLQTMGNVGTCLFASGRYAEAEEISLETLRLRREVLGDDHPDTLSSLNNVGVAMVQLEKYGEAERHLRESLAAHRRVMGEDHPLTLMLVNNLGALLAGQDKLTEAEEFYRLAVETRERKLGRDHPDTLLSKNNLAVLLPRLGKVDEAVEMKREILEARRRVLGDEHPDTAFSMSNLAVDLSRAGALDEAEALHSSALDIRRGALGPEHPDTIQSLNNLGRTLERASRFDEAEVCFREAAETARRVFGPDHRLTGVYALRHGVSLTSLGRIAEAEATLLESNRILEALLQPSDSNLRECRRTLAGLYDALEAAEPGQGYGEQAAHWRSRLGE